MKKLLLISTLLFLLTFSDYSRADTVFGDVALGCNREANQFMVRFGQTSHWPKIKEEDLFALPSDLKEKWASMSLSQTGECTLNNRQKIKLSKKSGQAFAYGYLGADPSVSFYLSIDDTAIYHRKTFYLKGGNYLFTSIYYDGAKLTQCANDTDITCKDVSERLSGTGLNKNEMAELEKDKEREKLENNLSQFCKALHPTSRRERIQWKELGSPIPGMYLAKAVFDINNDQVDEVVLKVYGMSMVFHGSFLIAFKEGDFEALNILSSIENGKLKILKSEGHAEIEAMGGRIINILPWQTPIHSSNNEPFRKGEETYIYSYATLSDTIPSAFISKVLPDYSIETMCEFP
jgi:hypothetical protein